MSKILQQAQLLQHQLQQEAETITQTLKQTGQHYKQNLQDDLKSEQQSYKNAIHQLVSSQITQFNDQLTSLTTQAITQLQQQVHDQCRTELGKLTENLSEHQLTQYQAHTQFQDQYLIQINQQQYQLDRLIQAYQQNLSQIQPSHFQTSNPQTSNCQTSVMLMWLVLAISLCLLAALMALIYHDQLWFSFLISLGVCLLLSLSVGGLIWYFKSPSNE